MANELTKSVLDEASSSEELKKKAKQIAKTKKIQIRKTKVKIYIWTGEKIEITSYYGAPKQNYTKNQLMQIFICTTLPTIHNIKRTRSAIA